MLKTSLVAALLIGAAGMAGPVSAQSYNSAPPSAQLAQNEEGVVVRERVISTEPTVTERTIVTGPAYRIPNHATGVSRINGSVGGAIGGYYIIGTSPADNRSLRVMPWEDAFQR